LGRIISIHSFRGGTGKSNTTANLAVLMAAAGNRVGVVDTDIQSPGIHVIFSQATGQMPYTLNDYLWGQCRIEQAAYDVTASAIGRADLNVDRPKLFLIPSSIETGAIARVLREGYDVALLNEGFQQLIQNLELDYLLIDTHPGVNEETLLSIAVSELLLLILRPDNQDFQGTSVAVELARRLEVQDILILINKVPSTANLEDLRRQVESAYGADVIATIPLCEQIAELASSGIFVNRYADHPVAQQLREVAQRVLQTTSPAS